MWVGLSGGARAGKAEAASTYAASKHCAYGIEYAKYLALPAPLAVKPLKNNDKVSHFV
jgi:hypothetical protein